MNQNKKELLSYLENIGLLVVGILLFAFPLLFLSQTTDAFVLPKEMLLALLTSLFLLIFGVKTIIDGKLKLRSSPFDIPIVLFIVIAFVSAILSVNRFDAIAAVVPLLFVILLYFGIVNVVRTEKQLLFIIGALTSGAFVSGFLSLLSFFKLYPLPFTYTHLPYFNTFGSLLDQAVYLALVIPLTGYFAYTLVSGMFSSRRKSPFEGQEGVNKKSYNEISILFTVAFVLLAASLITTLYMLFTTQKPLILPFETGLQTGFAAISQDNGNVIKSFLVGSGIGTYLVDFTRFKPASYNLNQNLWAFTFFRSSTYALELLATTGILGLAAFLFLVFKIFKEKDFFLPIILAVIAAIILPFSFTLVALFFILLSLFAVVRIHSNPNRFTEIEFYLVALKRGLFAVRSEGEDLPQNSAEKRYSKFLPFLFLLFLIVVISIPMYFAGRYFLSDITFQKSLVAASQNKGLDTYNGQIAAIKIFPYRDIYYRSFSQTNLALANSLASSQNGQKPSQDVQQNIIALIQQSINSARAATTLAPMTAFNWNNLSTIYRSLIGFGQNADRFTVVTSQQAIALDPNDPQQYVELGGIYYQLGQYDEAMRQFQLAINLKNDYANAYYNLGHSLEAKGNLQDALSVYETVRNLVANDKTNVGKIDDEITTLKDKIGKQAQAANPSANVQPQETQQQPLTVNKPSTTLPERKPQVKIPAPSLTPLPTASPTPTK